MSDCIGNDVGTKEYEDDESLTAEVHLNDIYNDDFEFLEEAEEEVLTSRRTAQKRRASTFHRRQTDKEFGQQKAKSSMSNHLNIAASEITSAPQTARSVLELVTDNTEKAIGQVDQPNTSQEVLDAIEVVNCEKTAQRLISKLLYKEEAVALECKGLNNKTVLLQLATMNGKCYIFDLYLNPKLMLEGRLHDLLTSASVVKVVHNCRLPSTILYKQFSVCLNNVFDTQCAYSVIESRRSQLPPSSLCAMSRGFISNVYGRCLPLPATNAIFRSLQQKPGAWMARPLPRPQLECAAREVLCLVPEAYQCLKQQLSPDMLEEFQTLIEKNLENGGAVLYGRSRQHTIDTIRRYQYKIQKLYESLYVGEVVKGDDEKMKDTAALDSINVAPFSSTSTSTIMDKKVRGTPVTRSLSNSNLTYSKLRKVDLKNARLDQFKKRAVDGIRKVPKDFYRRAPRRVAELLEQFQTKLPCKSNGEEQDNQIILKKTESQESEYFTSRTSADGITQPTSNTAVAKPLISHLNSPLLFEKEAQGSITPTKSMHNTISQYQETLDYLQRRLNAFASTNNSLGDLKMPLNAASQPTTKKQLSMPGSSGEPNNAVFPLITSSLPTSRATVPSITLLSPRSFTASPLRLWPEKQSPISFQCNSPISADSERKQIREADNLNVQIELLNLIKNYQQMIQELYKQLQHGRKVMEQRDLIRKIRNSNTSKTSINLGKGLHHSKTNSTSSCLKSEKALSHFREGGCLSPAKTEVDFAGEEEKSIYSACNSDYESESVFVQELQTGLDTDDDNVPSRPQRTSHRRLRKAIPKKAKLASGWKTVQWDCPSTPRVHQRFALSPKRVVYHATPKVDLKTFSFIQKHARKNGLIECSSAASSSTIGQNRHIRKMKIFKTKKCWEPVTAISSSSSNEKQNSRLKPNFSDSSPMQWNIHKTRRQLLPDTPRTYTLHTDEDYVEEEPDDIINTPSSRMSGQLLEDECSSYNASDESNERNSKRPSQMNPYTPSAKRHGHRNSVVSVDGLSDSTSSYHPSACFFNVEDSYTDYSSSSESIRKQSHKKRASTHPTDTVSQRHCTKHKRVHSLKRRKTPERRRKSQSPPK